MKFVGSKKAYMAMLDNYTPVLDVVQGLGKEEGKWFMTLKHGLTVRTFKSNPNKPTSPMASAEEWSFVARIEVNPGVLNGGQTDYQKHCIDYLLFKLGEFLAGNKITEPTMDMNDSDSTKGKEKVKKEAKKEEKKEGILSKVFGGGSSEKAETKTEPKPEAKTEPPKTEAKDQTPKAADTKAGTDAAKANAKGAKDKKK